jgi:hypothetical protein
MVEFHLSPREDKEIRRMSAISVGSIKFNCVTDYYQRALVPFFRFEFDQQKELNMFISRGGRIGERMHENRDWDIGVLQRLKDPERGSTIFIAAGLGANASRATVEYLSKNWRTLAREYGDGEFGICLRCPWFGIEPDGYRRYEVLLKLPR